MKSFMKKSLFLSLVFIFIFNLTTTNAMAATGSTPKYTVTVNDVNNKFAAKVSGVINYTVMQNREGTYYFSRAHVDSNTESKASGLKKWKVNRVNDYDGSRTTFLGEVEVEFYKKDFGYDIWYYGCASQEIKVDPYTGVVTVLRTWSHTENDW